VFLVSFVLIFALVVWTGLSLAGRLSAAGDAAMGGSTPAPQHPPTARVNLPFGDEREFDDGAVFTAFHCISRRFGQFPLTLACLGLTFGGKWAQMTGVGAGQSMARRCTRR
jgi:hypothetical protein